MAPAWGGPPPAPPRKSRVGLIVGLVLGGLVLILVLLGALGALVGGSTDNATDDAPEVPESTRTRSTGPSITGPGTTGPSTSVAGTGPRASLSSADVASLLKKNRQEDLTSNDVTLGKAACPPGPYQVGHMIICSVEHDGVPLLFRIEIVDVNKITGEPVGVVIDTRKAATLVESQEPGTSADCGLPRIRQVETGYSFVCTTAASTWDITVEDEEGTISSARR